MAKQKSAELRVELKRAFGVEAHLKLIAKILLELLEWEEANA